MSFLSGGMAWGALAAAAPIIIYLVMRQRYKVVVWAAMEFLLQAFKKTRKRRKIEEMILLALRTLALLLLPLGLAHPFLASGGIVPGQETLHRIILLDDSYSMGYRTGAETSFQRAKAAASWLIDEAKDKSAWITVMRASTLRIAPLASDENRLDELKTELEAITAPSQAGTDLVKAMKEAAKAVKKRPSATRRDLFLVTDMQRSGWGQTVAEDPEFAQAVVELGQAVRNVFVVDVGAQAAPNVQISSFAPNVRHISPERPIRFEVRVRNLGKDPVEAVPVSLWAGTGDSKGKRGEETIDQIPPKSERTVTFTMTFPEVGVQGLTASIPGDALPLDDKRYLAVPVQDKLQILLVSGKPGRIAREDEVFFLKVVFQDLDPQNLPFSVDYKSVFSFTDREEIDFSRYSTVILSNLRGVPPAQLERLKAYVKDGGSVVFTGGKGIVEEAMRYNNELFEEGRGLFPAKVVKLEQIPTEEQRVYGMAVQEDHPLFAGRRWSGLEEAGIRTFVVLEPPKSDDVRTLAWFYPKSTADASDRAMQGDRFPALIEKKYGAGRAMVFAASVDRDGDNAFPTSPYFLPFWHEIAYFLQRSSQSRNVETGQQVVIVDKADRIGQEMRIAREESDTPAESVHMLEEGNHARLAYPEDPAQGKTDASGLYSIRPAAGAPETGYFAVNVDPAEGEIVRMDEGELRQILGDRLSFTYCKDKAALESQLAQKGRGKDLWKIFLWTALALLCAETVLAWRFGMR